LKAGRPVELDFEGVRVFSSPFFNTGVGQLLKDLRAEDLRRLVTIKNITPVGSEVMKLVVENAKRFYSCPDYRAAQIKAIEALSEEE
jgi:hypothetical protein